MERKEHLLMVKSISIKAFIVLLFIYFVFMFVGCARKQETVLPDLTGYKYFGHQTYEERGEHKFVIYHTPRQSKEYYIETIDQRTMMVFPIVEESETPIVEESTEEKAHSMLNNSDVKFCTDDHCRE